MRVKSVVAAVAVLVGVWGAVAAAEPNVCNTDDDTCMLLLRRREVRAKARVATLESELRTGAAERGAADREARRLRESSEAERRELMNTIASLGRDMEETRRLLEQMKRARDAAERRAAQFRDLVDKFRSMSDSGLLQVEIRDGLMLLKLPDGILFNPGKVDVKTAGKDALAKITHVLLGLGRKLQVAGHTDNVPIKSRKFRSNWELSSARAVEVVRLMIDDGMDPSRLSAAGYADQLPVAPNDTPEGRARNRRIEIVVVPNLDELLSVDDKKP
jgi:chemotaxis protein MotB